MSDISIPTPTESLVDEDEVRDYDERDVDEAVTTRVLDHFHRMPLSPCFYSLFKYSVVNSVHNMDECHTCSKVSMVKRMMDDVQECEPSDSTSLFRISSS